MINGPRIDIKMSNRTINVPILKDKDTTYHIAKLVQERLDSIEENSKRIDTHAFAIEAAMSFAYAQLDAEDELKANTNDLMKELLNLSKALESITNDFTLPEK